MILKNFIRWLVLFLLLAVLLSACRRAKTPEPSPTQILTETPAAETAAPTARPSRTAEEGGTEIAAAPSALPATVAASPTFTVTASGGGAYPAPGLATPTPTTSSGTPYPAAGTSIPLPTATTSSGTPYPIGGTQQSPTVPSLATPRATISPAGPGTPTATLPSSGPTAYPGPQFPTQTKAPAQSVTPVSGTAGPTAALTPSVTPEVIRSRIRATDPRTFQVVSGQPQLVEFFTYDSPVSRSMAPVVHALEDRYDDRIRFVYLDLEDPANGLFASMLKGRMAPFFFLLDGQGGILEEWQGYVPVEDFETAFAAIGQ